MSENGDTQEQTAVNEIVRLVASIEVCAMRSERALEEAQSARHATERTERIAHDMSRTLKRLADDQLEMRSGIPSGWRDRLVLVVLTSVVSALIAAAVTRMAG